MERGKRGAAVDLQFSVPSLRGKKVKKKSHHSPFVVTGGWQQASGWPALVPRHVEGNRLKRMFKSFTRTATH